MDTLSLMQHMVPLRKWLGVNVFSTHPHSFANIASHLHSKLFLPPPSLLLKQTCWLFSCIDRSGIVRKCIWTPTELGGIMTDYLMMTWGGKKRRKKSLNLSSTLASCFARCPTRLFVSVCCNEWTHCPRQFVVFPSAQIEIQLFGFL